MIIQQGTRATTEINSGCHSKAAVKVNKHWLVHKLSRQTVYDCTVHPKS